MSDLDEMRRDDRRQCFLALLAVAVVIAALLIV